MNAAPSCITGRTATPCRSHANNDHEASPLLSNASIEKHPKATEQPGTTQPAAFILHFAADYIHCLQQEKRLHEWHHNSAVATLHDIAVLLSQI